MSMLPMRINTEAVNTTLVNQLDGAMNQLQQTEIQTATGKAINQPSDNPAGTATALTLNSQIGRYTQYAANATDGQSWLSATDSTLSDVSTALQQVQTSLETGANTSAQDSTTLAGLAADVTTIKQGLLTSANSSYAGSPLFSGTWGTQAYANAATGDYTYTGSSQASTRTVGPGQSVPVGVTGSSVFGSGTTSVFALLDKITCGNSAALQGTDTTQLEAAMNTVTDVRGQVGATTDELQTITTEANNKVTSLQASVSSIVDVDEAKAASQFALESTAYQAALTGVAKVIQPSLAEFLQ